MNCRGSADDALHAVDPRRVHVPDLSDSGAVGDEPSKPATGHPLLYSDGYLKFRLMTTPLASTRLLFLLAALWLSLPGNAQDAPQGSRVIAVVNGVEVMSDQPPGRVGSIPAGDYDSLSSAQKTQLLAAQINRQLLLEQARKEGFDQLPPIREAAQAIADTYVVEQFLLRVAAGFEFGEDAINTWYQQHYRQLPEQFLVSHIVLASESEGLAVLRELTEGATFEDLARSRSLDVVTANAGGQIGWLTAGEMAPTFARAVSSLKEGGVGESPVRTQSGWHVLRLDDRRDTPAPPLDAVRGEILQALAARQMSDYMEGLRSRASIQILRQP